ncbi:MAG: ATP-dependent DNA ligase [Mycobacteriales bacterium]
MLFADLVNASAAVRSTASRKAKTAALAAVLRTAEPDEVAPAVAYLSGEPRQRPLGVGWAALRDLPDPAATAQLTVGEVDDALDRIAAVAGSGTGSQATRRAALADLFGRATADEHEFLRGLLTGELRQGALQAIVTDAVAEAAGVPVPDVRRALMLSGDLGPVAGLALHEGLTALRKVGLRVGTPVQPMLASPAPDIAAAMDQTGEAAVEWKLDGIRVQVHRNGDDVRVFTRSLDDITVRVPEVVEAALKLPVTTAVLDGEAMAMHADGRPQPFQLTASRIGSRKDVASMRAAVPLTTYFFDLLHLDGADLLDSSGADRYTALAGVVPESQRTPRIVTADPAEAAAFFDSALAGGHEGVVVKSLSVPYQAGRRGAGWIKVKPRHTLDLVVLAAEWGHGRRRGSLSNLHLGARDPDTGNFVMLGKTFKGLTDVMLTWQTERLLELEVSRNEWQVFVRPELVVEVAIDGVQGSTRYPGGVALRFARVLAHRPDKSAAQADTIDAVRVLHVRARS